jgi:hypothetical protein
MKKLLPSMSGSMVAMILAISATAQSIDRIKDTPLTATIAGTRTDSHGTRAFTYQIARRSDGSTYVAESSNGRTYLITIQDIPSERTIQFFVPSPESHDYTYTVAPATRGSFSVISVEQNRVVLQRMQANFVDMPDRMKPDGTTHHEEALPNRQDNGMTWYGNRDTSHAPDGAVRVAEIWRSDLGLSIMNAHDDKGSSAMHLTSIRYEEPDPKLFEIPAEYLPGSDPLLNAKTIAIDNATGDPNVRAMATEQLRLFKRYQIEESQQKADLIATFLSASDTWIPVAMTVRTQNGTEPVFTCHLTHNPVDLRPVPANINGVTARSCVNDLENRVMNTHVGERNSVPHPMPVHAQNR